MLNSLRGATQLTRLWLERPQLNSPIVADEDIALLATFTQLRSLEALFMPHVTPEGWGHLGALSQLTRLGLSWQSAQTVHLLQTLTHLPLEQVCPHRRCMLGGKGAGGSARWQACAVRAAGCRCGAAISAPLTGLVSHDWAVCTAASAAVSKLPSLHPAVLTVPHTRSVDCAVCRLALSVGCACRSTWHMA